MEIAAPAAMTVIAENSKNFMIGSPRSLRRVEREELEEEYDWFRKMFYNPKGVNSNISLERIGNPF